MILSEALSTMMKSEMKRILDNIRDKNESSHYNITMTFTNPTLPSYTLLVSREISDITISQDFVNNISDKIIVNLELSANMYEALYNARANLMCELSFTPIDDGVAPIDDYTPSFCRQYRAILLNLRDIYKSMSGARLKPSDVDPSVPKNPSTAEPTFPLKVELVDNDLYAARHKNIHGIFGEVRMIDILRYVVSEFGFAKAYIAMPDNDNLYTNFVIPPDFGITDIMGYLQTGPGMGIYRNGLCSYVTDGAWYIFPRYGDSVAKRVVQVYSLGNNTIAGLKKYTFTETLDDGDTCTHVLLNTPVAENNWSFLGTENSCNAANVQALDRVMISSKQLVEDDKFNMKPVITNMVVVPTDVVNADEPVNMAYAPSMGNEFAIESSLGAAQNTVIGFGIETCDPFIFTPNTEVKFNYDHVDGYRSVSCKCESVEYVYKRSPKNLYPIFVGGASHVTLMYNNYDAFADGNA